MNMIKLSITLAGVMLVDLYALYSLKWPVIIVGIIATFALFYFGKVQQLAKDPYGTFHHALNRSPGKSKTGPPMCLERHAKVSFRRKLATSVDAPYRSSCHETLPRSWLLSGMPCFR
jgi:hypothetical protein